MDKTVFILGAGASQEIGLPVGNELTARIANSLDLKFETFGLLRHGNPEIVDAFRLHVERAAPPTRDIGPLVQAARRIHHGMPSSPSIDHFIDTQRGNPNIELCGKLAIVREILEAEHQSHIYVDPRQPDEAFNYERLRDTWFNAFWHLLIENCPSSDLPARLQAIQLVIFNYDRCVEHFLFHNMKRHYGMNNSEASALLSKLEVYRPYGSVGALPWQKGQNAVGFGLEATGAQLLTLSSQIKTFTEGTDPHSSEISAIRACVKDTRRLVFLGFAFHRQNMRLLFPESYRGDTRMNTRCFATAYNISDNDAEEIGYEIEDLTGIWKSGIHVEKNLKCVGLFHAFNRGLSLLST